MLLAADADVNVRNNHGDTVLILALGHPVFSKGKQLAILEAILPRVADVNVLTEEGKSALDLARLWESSEPGLVQILEKHGAKPASMLRSSA
jgi:ankyrin repeat protein